MDQKPVETYHIYGRTSYAQPLEFVELVEVGQGLKPDLPQGTEWVEVIAIPDRAIIRVIPRPDHEEGGL